MRLRYPGNYSFPSLYIGAFKTCLVEKKKKKRLQAVYQESYNIATLNKLSKGR